MKKKINIGQIVMVSMALLLKPFSVCAAALDASAGEAQPARIDWPAFMRQHDMTFNKLPCRWQEAPHFGNAMVGSMLYQVGDSLRLQLFRADVQDHRDDTWGWTAYSRPRLVIGYFSLHTIGKLTGCTWRKDLWNAELTGTITTDKGEITIRHFTHAVDMAIVTELTPSAGEKGFSWTWHPAEAKTTRTGYPKNEADLVKYKKAYGSQYPATLNVWQPNPEGRLEKTGDVSVWTQDLMAGGQYAIAWGEHEAGGTRTHVASIANSYPVADAGKTAAADVQRFILLDRSEWVGTHRAWWHDYYSRSYVTIPDKSLESLYWQTIYRYGCTTRTGRSMVNTPGLWFQGGQWPYITTDWNIQSAHWSVYAANRLEQGEEVVKRLHDGQDALAKAVRPIEWQNDSAYLALAVAPDMIGARDGDMRYYNLVGNLPWTLNNAWSQYRFSMDDSMLRETIYPLLRRSVNLYLHMVKEGADGKLHLPPTYSPESGVWQDCAFDLALFKWGCLTLLKASKRLGIADPLISRWKEVAARLPDFPVGDKGFQQGSDKPLHEHHRHQSHLLMIYPLYLVNIEQVGSVDVLRKSLLQAYDLKGGDSLAAMVQTHAAPIATALGDGDLALKGLKSQQADLLPNGLWACGGSPCIESTLSVANNIQEMLIQSWSDPAKEEAGPIRIFPALPAEWKDVEFHDLRTEGAFLVSAKRVGGQTQWIRIKSLAGEPCRVKSGIKGHVTLTGDRPFTLKPLSPEMVEIDLKKGEEVVLQSTSVVANTASVGIQPPLPNIVFILADDLGYGDVGCYNPATKVSTPNLDRLAKDGLLFADAHSPSTVCTPTRYSILTGRMAFRTGMKSVFTGVAGPCLIEQNRLTLPEMLRTKGYTTALFGKWHIGMSFFDKDGSVIRNGGIEGVKRIDYSRAIPDAPIHRGFDQFFGTVCCPTTDFLYAFVDGDRIPVPPTRMIDKAALGLPTHIYSHDCRAGLIAPDFNMEEVDMIFLDKSERFLEQQVTKKPGKPFFLFHSCQAVHQPSFPGKNFKGKTKAGPHGDFIFEFDAIVGRLLAKLQQLGVAENTLVIISSDNGPEIDAVVNMRKDYGHDGARPWRGIKRDDWEGGHRVPMIARWPGRIKPGTRTDQTVCLTDVMATCAALVGAPLPDNAAEDSFNMLPVLLGTDGGKPIREFTLHQTSSLALAIREGKWKYLDHKGSGGNRYDLPDLAPYALVEKAPSAPGQLYDLEKDPGETDNLYFKHPEVVKHLKAKLDQTKASGRSRGN